jgi:hypothetical protein
MLGSTGPVSCVAGSYSAAGSTECTVCPPGSSCPLRAVTPTQCSDGFFSEMGQGECKSC